MSAAAVKETVTTDTYGSILRCFVFKVSLERDRVPQHLPMSLWFADYSRWSALVSALFKIET